MSKTAKKKNPERKHPPRKRTTTGFVSGIVWRGDEDDEPIAGKIVLLGKENLEKLRGYKAFLDLLPDGQVCLTITGLSPQSGLALFDSLDKMEDDEIHGK
jgi:hypothetical protein